MDLQQRIAALEQQVEELKQELRQQHGHRHELSGEDPVRLSVQNSGTQLNRQRTLNAGTNLTATEDSSNKRITLSVDDPLSITMLDLTEMTPPGTPSANVLRLYAEDYKGFSFFSFKDATGMVRKLVRDSVFVGYNNTGQTIAAHRIVYAAASFGDVPSIALAQADDAGTMPAIGVTVEAIADEAYGRVMQVGLLENVNTSAYAAGDVLYVSAATAGIPTATEPAYPNIRQEIGTILVSDAAVGAIQIVARTAIDYDFGSAGIAADNIVESTGAAGVTIEQVLLKDGNVIIGGATEPIRLGERGDNWLVIGPDDTPANWLDLYLGVRKILHYGTGYTLLHELDDSGNLTASGYIKGADYYSGDGSQGMTGTVDTEATPDLVIKDGLVISAS